MRIEDGKTAWEAWVGTTILLHRMEQEQIIVANFYHPFYLPLGALYWTAFIFHAIWKHTDESEKYRFFFIGAFILRIVIIIRFMCSKIESKCILNRLVTTFASCCFIKNNLSALWNVLFTMQWARKWVLLPTSPIFFHWLEINYNFSMEEMNCAEKNLICLKAQGAIASIALPHKLRKSRWNENNLDLGVSFGTHKEILLKTKFSKSMHRLILSCQKIYITYFNKVIISRV